MKPRNFPARKLARQEAARLRASGEGCWSAKEVHDGWQCGGHVDGMDQARAIRTKKSRA